MPSTRALPCPQLVAALDLPDKDRALSLARYHIACAVAYLRYPGILLFPAVFLKGCV